MTSSHRCGVLCQPQCKYVSDIMWRGVRQGTDTAPSVKSDRAFPQTTVVTAM